MWIYSNLLGITTYFYAYQATTVIKYLSILVSLFHICWMTKQGIVIAFFLIFKLSDTVQLTVPRQILL